MVCDAVKSLGQAASGRLLERFSDTLEPPGLPSAASAEAKVCRQTLLSSRPCAQALPGDYKEPFVVSGDPKRYLHLRVPRVGAGWGFAPNEAPGRALLGPCLWVGWVVLLVQPLPSLLVLRGITPLLRFPSR